MVLREEKVMIVHSMQLTGDTHVEIHLRSMGMEQVFLLLPVETAKALHCGMRFPVTMILSEPAAQPGLWPEKGAPNGE